MILHLAAMAAFFVDQATQPQCLVKCVSDAGHDPIWARLLFEAVPSIFALGIAALVFYWNGGREHKRWVLDQKRAEWKELLIRVAAIEEIIPCITTGSPDYEPLNDSVRAVLPLLRGNIFIYSTVESSGFIGRWESYANDVSGDVDAIKGDNIVQRDPPELLNPGDKEGSTQLRKAAEWRVRMKLHELREELRMLAHQELGI
jgi:hypothetical protein